LAAPVSFHQDLINQLNTFILNDDERDIAEFLVGSIDDMGYIRRSVPDIVDDMAFTQGLYTDDVTVERMLTVIHELEPSGVGARDLQECLLLQLKHKTPSESVELATDIIENQFDAFTKKALEKLIQKYNVSNEQLKSNSRNRKAQSKTRWCFYGNNKITENVVPDFAIRIVDGELELTLNGRNAPSLHVSKDYQEMMQTYKESTDKSGPKRCSSIYQTKLDSAKWFIDAIRQRQETLL
jgi:RNA polymerase sigma-54 factor